MTASSAIHTQEASDFHIITGPLKMQDLTLQDLTMEDQIAGVDNARPDIGRPNDETLDGANSSILHTRFKLCKKLISQQKSGGDVGYSG